jgi:SAM-dependent methyltransferase
MRPKLIKTLYTIFLPMQQAVQHQTLAKQQTAITECMQKVPSWKKLLSYIYPLKVECTSSSINPKLDVILKQGRYQLCTPNAVYSYGDLYDNFTRSFDAIELDLLDIRRVLVLGFGLGSVPVILEKIFEKDYHYTGVEIDAKIIELAQKYVLPEVNSSINLICEDAQSFVNQCKEKFDLIAIDLFIDDKVPQAFEEFDFLHKINNILAPDGVLLYNRLSFNKKDLKETKNFYESHFNPTFPNATFLDVDGNWMLLNRADILRTH